MKTTAGILALLAIAAMGGAQTAPATDMPLARQFHDGQTLSYAMTGVNEDWHYQAQADGVVKKNAQGAWVEEYQWSKFVSAGQATALAPSMTDFRQTLSLDPNVVPAVPDLTKVDPRLIGPITDFMTFYIDLWLMDKTGAFHKAGDHLYVPNGKPSSWADGTQVLTGESAIDFDLTLKSIDALQHTAVVVARHVPPPKSTVRLPAAWMQTPVEDTPNNWVSIARDGAKYQAAMGKETFEVEMTVSTVDGRILSGVLDNIVQTVQRTCDDAALTTCSAPQPHTIHRHIEIALQP
jgi:hypothetical protein